MNDEKLKGKYTTTDNTDIKYFFLLCIYEKYKYNDFSGRFTLGTIVFPTLSKAIKIKHCNLIQYL